MEISKALIRKVAEATRKLVVEKRDALMAYTTPLNLAGACGHSSIFLCHQLKEAGLPAELVQGSGHWFVKCGAWLVDITASQFSQGKICIRDFETTQKLVATKDRAMDFWRAGKTGDHKQMGLSYCAPSIEKAFGIKL